MQVGLNTVKHVFINQTEPKICAAKLTDVSRCIEKETTRTQ